jgi:hypothetical protein
VSDTRWWGCFISTSGLASMELTYTQTGELRKGFFSRFPHLLPEQCGLVDGEASQVESLGYEA